MINYLKKYYVREANLKQKTYVYVTAHLEAIGLHLKARTLELPAKIISCSLELSNPPAKIRNIIAPIYDIWIDVPKLSVRNILVGESHPS